MTGSGEPTITILVDTSTGTFARRIRPAAVLPEGGPRGPSAEAATRGAAAVFGLPDFVFHPVTERRGPGVREIGDALIVTGDMGLAIQVKARQAVSGDPERERSWLQQKAQEGARQASGTIRRLRYPVPTRLQSLRGLAVSVMGREIDWLPVVILDHPGVPGLTLDGPTVALSRRDWEFLFEQLQSTVAVVGYLHRVAQMEPPEFSQEAVRYYQLAQADAATAPGPVDTSYADLPIRNESSPELPVEPARRGTLIRWILEDIAEVPAEASDEAAAGRLNLLAAIDSAPLGTRAQMADTILGWLEAVQRAPGEAVWWRFRHYLYFGRIHLILGVCNRTEEVIREAFGNLVLLRHIERGERNPGDSGIKTVGVLLQPRASGRPWDTTAAMPRGRVELSPDERAAIERVWGRMEDAVARAGDDRDPFESARIATEGNKP